MPQRSGRAKNSASATANNEPEPSSKRETRQEPVRMCNWSNKTDGATGITWCPLHSPQSGRHLPETPAFSNWVCKFLLQWIADFFEIKLNVSALWLSGSVASGQWFGWLVCWPLNYLICCGVGGDCSKPQQRIIIFHIQPANAPRSLPASDEKAQPQEERQRLRQLATDLHTRKAHLSKPKRAADAFGCCWEPATWPSTHEWRGPWSEPKLGLVLGRKSPLSAALKAWSALWGHRLRSH